MDRQPTLLLPDHFCDNFACYASFLTTLVITANNNLERSHIQHWVHNLSPVGEPEWDNYFRTPPTYKSFKEFWDSRQEAAVRNRILSSPESIYYPENKIELVETVSSGLDSHIEILDITSKSKSPRQLGASSTHNKLIMQDET